MPQNSAPLDLEPPLAAAPVQLIAPDATGDQQAMATIQQNLPLPQEQKSELQLQAERAIDVIAEYPANSPRFAEAVEAIHKIGADDISASTRASNRLLARPAVTEDARNPQAKTASTLNELRNIVSDLDPGKANLDTPARKLLKFVPGGQKIDNYFAKYRSAQSQIDDILRALNSSKNELALDNAAIKEERVAMWQTLGKLNLHAERLTALEAAAETKHDQLEITGDNDKAGAFKTDVMFAIGQRRQDVMTQAAVTLQGYLALGLIHGNNNELIRGVQRAESVTVSALQVAITVSQALGTQKLVLEQITALNSTTSSMIESTAAMLQQQGARIHTQAASSTIEIERLQRAFDATFQAFDEMDKFRADAVSGTRQPSNALQAQVQRAEKYVSSDHRRRAMGS